MSRQTVLARGRAAAEAGMADTCTIRHTTGTTTDDLTGAVTPTQTVVYTGPCRYQTRDAQGLRVESGAVSSVVLRREVQLPVTTSTGVSHGDELTVDTCVNDASLVGRVFSLRDIPGKSEATARRMSCEEPT